MEKPRQTWMQRQTRLRKILESTAPPAEWRELLLSQHAMLHDLRMAGTEPWSYADEVLDGLRENQWREIPHGGEHSITWMIWHIARIEDTAMNLLVAGGPQVCEQDGWAERIQASKCSSGNEMDPAAIASLSRQVDLQALREYRAAVGRQTRQIILALQTEDLKQKVDPTRIQRVKDAGAIEEQAYFITDYWSRRTLAGLLLMPATRHNFVHLNEAAGQVKKL